MSTYYALACEQCKAVADLARRGGGGWGAMADTPFKFLEKHSEHLSDLRVVSEHDPRWDQYTDESDDASS